MKRVLMGIVWFFVIWIAGSFLIGAIIGGIAGAHVSGTPSYSSGAEAGRTASTLFFQKYGTLVFLGTVAAAVAGTVTGFLPGTRRPAPPAALPYGQYPPPPGQYPPPGQWPPPPGGQYPPPAGQWPPPPPGSQPPAPPPPGGGWPPPPPN